MIKPHSTLLSLVIAALACTGCDTNESCAPLAKHITAINVKAAKEKPDDKMIAKSEKELTDACNKEPPEKAVIDCAMKAQTPAELIACEPTEDGDKGEAKGDEKDDAKADDAKADDAKPADEPKPAAPAAVAAPAEAAAVPAEAAAPPADGAEAAAPADAQAPAG